MSALESCYHVFDFARAARKRLPEPLFHYIDGGADDEVTLRGNTAAFGQYELLPSFLRDVRTVKMARTVLGRELAWPLILAPTGMSRLFHPEGERAVAVEAMQSGVGYALSTMATTGIEEIAAVSSGAKIFQLYLFKDDAMNMELIDRCKAARYDALCLTVDTIVPGNRERDLRHGLTVPPRLGAANLLHFARRPRWCYQYLTGSRFGLPNVPMAGGDADLRTLTAFFAARMENHITWARVERIARHWGKPFAIKGLQSVADARLSSSAGATAIVVSNHGGRQLDGGAGTIDLIADIVDAVGDRLEVIHDGGVRRGSHIVKALAMGARACMIGRPYLYALAAFGQPGVARFLRLLRAETERTLALLGCANVDDVGRDQLRAAGALPDFLNGPRAASATRERQWSNA